MNKLLLIVALFFSGIFILPAQAQDDAQNRQERRQNIKNAKIAFLTEKLSLTTEQAQKFWPLYNQYETEKRSLWHSARVFKDQNIETMSDQQLREGLNKRIAFQEQGVNLEKQYLDKFLKVISTKQVALLYRSEREFTDVMLQKLDARRGNRN